MATNDDLDDFFKKKDRKASKPKKQTGILTNNEELLKQLVIVTSATSAFKENMDFEDEDDGDVAVNNHARHQFVDESNGITENNNANHAVIHKNQINSTAVHNKSKTTTKLSVQDNNNLNEQQPGVGGQQDEWEEFEDPKLKYNKLRLQFARAGNDQNNSDEDEDNNDYDGHGHNHDGNTDENINSIAADDEQSSRNNRRREQQKDKPAWKLDPVKATESVPTNDTTDSHAQKVEEPVAQSKPATATTTTSSAYRPPALRGNAAVTVVSGITQRPSKKEKPNLASTEEFPTLGAAVNKK